MVILDRMLKIDVVGHQAEVPVKLYLPVNLGDHWQCEYEMAGPIIREGARPMASILFSVSCSL